MLEPLDQDSIVILSTVYSEGGNSSPGAWAMITNCILNRFVQGANCDKLGHGFEWRGMNLIQICKTGFDGCKFVTPNYREAFEYFSNRISQSPKPFFEEMILTCHPIIKCDVLDNTGGATLYFSPKAQAALHAKDPDQYKSVIPAWAKSDLVEPVSVPYLLDTDDFFVMRYKAKAT